jgi:hypothetical protein
MPLLLLVRVEEVRGRTASNRIFEEGHGLVEGVEGVSFDEVSSTRTSPTGATYRDFSVSRLQQELEGRRSGERGVKKEMWCGESFVRKMCRTTRVDVWEEENSCE